MFSKRTLLQTLVFVGVAASTSLVARADTLNFTLTGPGTDITFSLPSSPTVSSSSSTYGLFALNSITQDVNGTNLVNAIDFYTSGPDGGGASSPYLDIYGPQLFTGTLTNPTFLTGDFSLTSNPAGSPLVDYNLEIATTPEPSSLLLLATGVLALIGAGSVKRFTA